MVQFDIISWYPCFSSIFACFLLLILHVGSFQVYDSRDQYHPVTIKKEMCMNVAVMIISFLIMKNFLFIEQLNHHTLFELLGIRQPGFLNASILPLLHTMIFLLGPICVQALPSLRKLCSEGFTMSKDYKLFFICKVFVTPLYEEFIFRACMMLLLLQCYKLTTAIFINALIFGCIHLKNIWERIEEGSPLRDIILALTEFLYYCLFGAYFALIFVKTGHIVAPYFAHAFHNVKSPNFFEVLYYKNSKKVVFVILSLSGIVLGYSLLTPLTNHLLYNNNNNFFFE